MIVQCYKVNKHLYVTVELIYPLSANFGQSRCNTVVEVTLKQSPLPERVYSCVPFGFAHCSCYLLYLLIFFREDEPAEIAVFDPPLHRHSSEMSPVQQVASVFLLQYGVYDGLPLLKVLEEHLNSSIKAILAEHMEMREIKTVLLQN